MSNTGRPVVFDIEYAKAAARSRPKGIGRLVSGRFTLDRILRATATTPEAMAEVGRARVERLHADRNAERRRVREAQE
jgi:hypothetical protein